MTTLALSPWHPRALTRVWSELIAFLRRPEPDAAMGLTPWAKIHGTLAVLLLKLIAVLALALFAGVLDLDPQNISAERLQRLYSPLGLLLVGALILPLLEETAFRLALRFAPAYLALALGVFTYYLMSKVIYQARISDIETAFVMRVGVAGAVAVLGYAVLWRPDVATRLRRFWAQHFAVVFYGSAVAFAAIHAFNYVLTPLTVLLLPLITLPQFIGGLCYGYIRVRFGFSYAYGFHALSNALAIGLALLAPGD